MPDTRTPDAKTLVAVYATHDAAEAAIRKIAESGLDMKHFSIVGKGYHTEEKAIGFYSTGDRVQFWGSRGAYWGGLWGLLFGGMMLTIPVVGPVMVLGTLSASVFAAIAGAVEGAVVIGGLGALGAALFSIGIPHHSVLQYESALKADNFLILAHGSAAEIERARALLQATGPMQMETHDEANRPVVTAA
jgi:hypothetical protein